MKLIVSSFLVATLAVVSTQAKWVDLTYALNKDVVVWPGRKITFNTEFEGPLEGGGWLASKGFCISEHTATHIDAPYHFYKEGRTLDAVPLETLLDVPGVVIDIYSKVHQFENGQLKVVSNYVLTRQDLIDWESVHGEIPAKSLVLVRTGWGKRWHNADDYYGIKPEFRKNATAAAAAENEAADKAPTVDLDAGRRLNFPGFDASAATFLTTERNVYGVGIDTLSIDTGNTKDFPAHKIFTKRQVYMLENVANIHLLPETNFRLWAVPFKVDAGTGSPTRLLAKLPDSDH